MRQGRKRNPQIHFLSYTNRIFRFAKCFCNWEEFWRPCDKNGLRCCTYSINLIVVPLSNCFSSLYYDIVSSSVVMAEHVTRALKANRGNGRGAFNILCLAISIRSDLPSIFSERFDFIKTLGEFFVLIFLFFFRCVKP